MTVPSIAAAAVQGLEPAPESASASAERMTNLADTCRADWTDCDMWGHVYDDRVCSYCGEGEAGG
jgi:hypothetical protein